MDQGQPEIIKLDGSFGTSDLAELTIITNDVVEGEKEVTYQFPFSLIDFEMLNKHVMLKLITGYKIIRKIESKEGQ